MPTPTLRADRVSDEERQVRLARMALARRRPRPLPPMRREQRYQPARKVVRRSHKGPVVIIHSERHGRVDCEHYLERDFVLRMLADPEVFELRHQPMELHWNDDGVRRKHYPDFSYRRLDRRFVAEIKMRKESLDPLVQRRTAAMVRRFAREAITYEVVTDEWIRAEPYLGNAKLLYLSAAYEPTAWFLAEMSVLFRTCPDGVAVEAIPDAIRLPPDAIYLGLSMVRNGHARVVEPDVPLGPHSLIVGAVAP